MEHTEQEKNTQGEELGINQGKSPSPRLQDPKKFSAQLYHKIAVG